MAYEAYLFLVRHHADHGQEIILLLLPKFIRCMACGYLYGPLEPQVDGQHLLKELAMILART